MTHNDARHYWPHTGLSRSNDHRVQAIRRDPVIGWESCSVVNECYSDAYLVERLNDAGITSDAAAVRYFRPVWDTFAAVTDETSRA
jgi:hypothetical protein